MIIKYYGHSCFTITSDGYTIALDPYNSMVPGYPELHINANNVYCSHEHGDHNHISAVKLVKSDVVDPFKVTDILVPHDHHGGAKRGMNTIRIFEAEGKKIIHFGDTGCVPAEDTIEKLKGSDVALIPVGGFYTIDSREAVVIAEMIAPKLIIPMHYKSGSRGLPVIMDLKDFVDASAETGLAIKPMEYLEATEI